MPEKGFGWFICQVTMLYERLRYKKKKKGTMQRIVYTTGTKDKMDRSTSAKTNCQLRIRLSRQACLNKPVNMALLTYCNGVPCQAKCCVFSSQVMANWFYTATVYQPAEFREILQIIHTAGRQWHMFLFIYLYF